MVLIRCALPSPFCITPLSAYRVCITARARLLSSQKDTHILSANTAFANNGPLFFYGKPTGICTSVDMREDALMVLKLLALESYICAIEFFGK